MPSCQHRLENTAVQDGLLCTAAHSQCMQWESVDRFLTEVMSCLSGSFTLCLLPNPETLPLLTSWPAIIYRQDYTIILVTMLHLMINTAQSKQIGIVIIKANYWMVYLYNPNSSATANALPVPRRFQQAAVGYINPCNIKPGTTSLLPPKAGRTWKAAGLLSKVTACLLEMRKPHPVIPASTHLNWSPFFIKSLQFCSNVSVRFREDKAPPLSLQCYVPSHRYLLCLCLTDYYTPQCQIFFLPAKVFVNNTPFLHSEKIKLRCLFL